jgi:hypothetical protein
MVGLMSYDGMGMCSGPSWPGLWTLINITLVMNRWWWHDEKYLYIFMHRCRVTVRICDACDGLNVQAFADDVAHVVSLTGTCAG